MLWDGELSKYAKILSYKKVKEETFLITKEQILELHKNSCANLKYDIEQLFPSAFKEEKKELVVGKWYWRCDELAVWNGGKHTYGFNRDGSWLEDMCFSVITNPIEATPKEVEEALIKEAVKRGFKEGVCVKNHQGTNVLKSLKIVYTNEYNDGIYTENQDPGVWIFINGVWSDIIPTLTKQQAEEKLNCKII